MSSLCYVFYFRVVQVLKMLALTDSPLLFAKTFEIIKIPASTRGTVVRS